MSSSERSLLIVSALLAALGAAALAGSAAVTQLMADASGGDADMGGYTILFSVPLFIVLLPAAFFVAAGSAIVAVVSLVQEGWRWAWAPILAADAFVLINAAEPVLQILSLLLQSSSAL